jgi:protein-S-isoprenylcysteine O-methyltransferase Ste14
VTSERLLDGLVLAALAGLALLAVVRGAMLSARGVRLLPIDRERSPFQALADLAFVLAFLLWGLEVVAFAWPLDLHLAPAWARAVVLDWLPSRILGAAVVVAGLVVYALALHALGSSWRLGIDREAPGTLVTGGIFARSRNPVYLGLALLALGSFLVLGRLVLLLLAVGFAAYGVAYLDYARRVGRWWTWRPSG